MRFWTELPITSLLLLVVLAGCTEDPKPTDESERDGGVEVDAAEVLPDAAPDASPDAQQPDALTPDAAPPPVPCAGDDECDPGASCDEGFCTEPECRADGECGNPMLQACLEGVCVDRCFGPNTCFRGGICIDNVCQPPECEDDDGCAGEDLCREGLCVEAEPCAGNDECGEDERCVDANCEPLSVCAGDRNCAADEICDGGRCRPQPTCERAAECVEGQDCVGGRCVPYVCRGDDDCMGDRACIGGECVEPPMEGEGPEVSQVVILNRPQTLVVGQTLVFRAVGLSERGDIVTARGFEWSVGEDDAGQIDPGGVLAVGPGAGSVSVTASFGDIDSAPVSFRVIALEPVDGLRVSVTGSVDGQPVVGAVVAAGEARGETDADGVAVLDEVEANATVTVFADGFDYVSLVGVAGRDLHVPLPARSNGARVAGFTGAMDFDQVMSEGGVDLGLAGGAIGGGLTNISLATILGELFNVEINAGPVNFAIPLPGGLTAAADVPILGRVDLKQDYFVTAAEGFQLGWGFAGRIDINVLFQLAGGGGGFDVGRVLATLFPFFDQFQHGLRVAEDLGALPRVADEDDVDGDGDIEEPVPDYERFPSLNIEPAQDQSLRLSVTVPALPEGEGTPVVLLFAGVEVESVGFVPLGLSSTAEPEAVAMRMAPPYGGLEVGDPVVLALAATFSGGGGGGGFALPTNLSAVMSRFSGRLPGDIQLAEFLAEPIAPEWDPALRELGAGAVDGADIHRAVMQGDAGAWYVYFGEGAAPEITLPFPPQGQADLAAASDIRVEAMDLVDADFEALVGLGGPGSIDQIDRFTAAFSRATP